MGQVDLGCEAGVFVIAVRHEAVRREVVVDVLDCVGRELERHDVAEGEGLCEDEVVRCLRVDLAFRSCPNPSPGERFQNEEND